MITRLGAYGGARQRYGSFAGKNVPTKAGGTVTRLGAYGGPRQEYGSFAGKATAGEAGRGNIIRLGAYGGPRPRIGSYAGKAQVIDFPAQTGGGGGSTGKRARVNDDLEIINLVVNILNVL